MKVILNKDIPKIGDKDDILDVAEGYARNFLFPRKLAIPVDSMSMNALEKRKKAAEAKLEKERENLKQVAEKLNELSVEVKADVGEEGKLFGSVTSHDISAAIKELIGIDVDKKQIQLDEPIKIAGKKPVKIRFTSDITATISLLVSPKK